VKIAGLQKMTLLDFPGKVACTVFLQGCNYRCPFCHNSSLLPPAGDALMDEEALLAFLGKRRGLLDGVCVSGGEPTLSPDLPALLEKLKGLGFLTKLDTNGSRPEVLRALAAQGLLDYVAMDVKNSPARYGETVGLPGYDLTAVEESLRFLLSGSLPFELRTTVVRQLHTPEDMDEMGRWLASLVPECRPEKLFLQTFVDRESVLRPGLSPCSPEETLALQAALAPYVGQVLLRG